MVHLHSILVVDDDQGVRDVIYEPFLQKMPQADVRLACDGHDGIRQLLQGWRPCLILLDFSMPGMDGNGFLRALGEHQLGHIPVVTMSAMERSSFIPLPQVVEFLEKPFSVKEILSSIARHCGANSLTTS